MQRLAIGLFSSSLLLGSMAVSAETLLDIYRDAMQHDPQVRAAEASWLASQEALPQSRAGLLPQISARAYRNRSTDDPKHATSTTGYTSGYGLELSQSLYNHQNYVRLRQANALMAQATASYEAEQQGLILRVSSAYFNLLSAKDDLATAEANKTAIGQQLRQTQQRFEVGLSAITDVHEAQAAFDAAVAGEIAAQNGVDIAREALREIVGRQPGQLARLGSEMPLISPEPADIEAWVNTALEQNLGLLAVDAGARQAAEGINLSRAGHYPTLGLSASYDHGDRLLQGMEGNRTTVGVQLSVPIYSGGLTTSQTREARARYNEANERLEQQRRATVRDARTAYMNVIAGTSQVQARRQALSSAQTAQEATEAGFEVGTRTMVDVLQAQSLRFLAERDYARARYDYALAILQLKAAAGSLAEADVAELSSWLER